MPAGAGRPASSAPSQTRPVPAGRLGARPPAMRMCRPARSNTSRLDVARRPPTSVKAISVRGLNGLGTFCSRVGAARQVDDRGSRVDDAVDRVARPDRPRRTRRGRLRRCSRCPGSRRPVAAAHVRSVTTTLPFVAAERPDLATAVVGEEVAGRTVPAPARRGRPRRRRSSSGRGCRRGCTRRSATSAYRRCNSTGRVVALRAFHQSPAVVLAARGVRRLARRSPRSRFWPTSAIHRSPVSESKV